MAPRGPSPPGGLRCRNLVLRPRPVRGSVTVSPASLILERILPLSILVLAVVAVPVMMLSPTGLHRLQGLREERVRADAEVQRVSREIHRLRAEVHRIKTDLDAVEQAARDELGLVRQTEVVFQFDH